MRADPDDIEKDEASAHSAVSTQQGWETLTCDSFEAV